MNPVAPLLKWPGGKRFLLKHILPLVPNEFGRYYEPFVGGGAVFFALRPSNAVLSDRNPDLINCYRQVRDKPDHVIARLKELRNDKDTYYRVRSDMPRDLVGRAARLIYLTKLSFNGIYRQNLQGEFNVPYGYKLHIDPCSSDHIRKVSESLQGVELRCADFAEPLRGAKKNDLIYFDPPYTVAHNNNGFVKYNAKIFSWADQKRLARVANDLVGRGCHVLVSNAFHSSISDLYTDFQHEHFARHSIIAASQSFRGEIKESLFYSRRGK